jgi:hypothetical protein
MIVMPSLSRQHFRVHLLILLLGAWTAGLHANPPQSASSDEELLSRVGKYVQELEDHLAVVIADETYHQDVWTKGWRGDQQTASRAIRSETLFMSLTQDGTWLSVRNVLSVGGRSIQEDSKGRLDRILKSPGLDYFSQLLLLKAESARFDIGQVWRTTGDPTLVFRFFLPANQSRFTFGKPRHEKIDGIDVVKVAFDEREHPTAIDYNGQDVLSHGAVWIRPDEGAIVRTYLKLTTNKPLDVSVVVSFSRDARLNVWVPHRMEESYDDGRQRTTCTATYANFRRFETSGRLIVQ